MTDTPATIRVYLLDDHEVVREGLRALLESPAIEVVGDAGSAAEATGRMPGAAAPTWWSWTSGCPTVGHGGVPRGPSSRPSISALMLTSYDDDEALFAAIMAGASGYMLKQIGGTDLVGAVRQVAAGNSLIDPSVTTGCWSGCGTRSPPPGARRADRAGAQAPGADRRGADQPADRRADVPRGEDGEELRLQHPLQARARAPYPGGRAGLEAARTPGNLGPSGRDRSALTRGAHLRESPRWKHSPRTPRRSSAMTRSDHRAAESVPAAIEPQAARPA